MPDPHLTSQRALRRYHRQLRPWRITYAVAVLVLIAAGAAVVKLAYAHGELSHTHLVSASAPATSVPLDRPSTQLHQAWQSADHTAIGTPFDGGTVVTYSTHAVVGRDARTGDVRWSYTRTDRTTCTAAQLNGVTIAVFRLSGDCDELTGLSTSSGARLWTRTLDEDSHLAEGTPTFSARPDTLMITTPQVIYALSPDGSAATGNGGLDRWVFAQQGCTINAAVLGSAGALISQTCKDQTCTGLAHCGDGPQLLLRDPFAGQDTDDKKNPDQISWNLIGNTMRPVSAGSVISAVTAGGGTLTVLSKKKGKAVATLPLTAPAHGRSRVTPTATGELIRIGRQTYAIDTPGTKFVWHSGTTALPTVTATGGEASPPVLADARLAVPTATGLAQLNPATGRVRQSFHVDTPAAGSRVYPFGTGFLVAGPRTVLYR